MPFQRKEYIVKQVYKLIFIKEHLMEVVEAAEDWHKEKVLHLIKARLVFFRGDLGKCIAGPQISWFCQASFYYSIDDIL